MKKSNYLHHVFTSSPKSTPSKDQIINLASSEPDYKFPNKYNLLSSIKANASGSSFGGQAEIKEIVSREFNTSSDRICCISGGASAVNYVVMQTILEDGDEVILESPGYDPHASIVNSRRNIEHHFVDILANDLISELDQKINQNTKLIVLTVPNNPSGKIIDLEAVITHIENLNQNREKEIYLLFDQVYFELSNQPCPFAANLSDYAITTYGLSKCYGLSSLKFGLIAANPELIQKFLAYNTLSQCTNSTILEDIWLTFFQLVKKPLQQEIYSDWKKKSENLINLAQELKLDLSSVDGGNTGLVKINCDDKKFVDQLFKQTGVKVTPGSFFFAPQYIRVGFLSPSEEELSTGLEQIAKIL